MSDSERRRQDGSAPPGAYARKQRRPPFGLGLAVLLASLIGVALLLSPLVGVAVLGLLGVGVVACQESRPRSRVFLVVLGFVLAGYAFMGRGFAYLGFPPLYVGEMTLGLGIVVVARGATLAAVPRWVLLPTMAYMSWGAMALAVSRSPHGVDALRDAVVWGYAAFLPLCCAAALHAGWRTAFLQLYRRVIPVYLVALPAMLLLSRTAPEWLPRAPGSAVPVVFVYGGDAAVHLAGIAGFLLLGCGRGHERPAARPFLEWVLWALWVVSFFIVASGRAAILTVLLPLVCLGLVCRRLRWRKPLVALAVATVIMVGGGLAFDPGEDYSGVREISPRQVLTNLKGVFGQSGDEQMDSTREWRLQWWARIVQYTFGGEYFWLGKGFGVNLANEDGFQVLDDESLRSPHNGHLTVLARMGVPGFLAYVGLLAVFGSRCLVFYRRNRSENGSLATTSVWLLCYWIAFLVNATFNVAMESPQSGIWFWSLMGFTGAVVGGNGRVV